MIKYDDKGKLQVHLLSAKKIEEMQPRMENTFKSMKNFSDTISETSKENVSLNREVDNLKLRIKN